VSTSVDNRSEVGERPPDWSQVPDPATVGRAPNVAIALRAGIGLAVVALLWLLGHRLAAVLLLAMLALATVGALRFPAVASGLDRATRTIERVAGRVLTVVLLSVLYVFVFTPLALLLRLMRIDPLDVGRSSSEPSLWRPTVQRPAGALYHRQFTYEPLAASDDVGRYKRSPLRRVLAVLGVVAALLLADLGIGAVLHAGDRPTDARAAAQKPSLLPSAAVPAGRLEPWAKELGQELGQVYYGQRYDPYLGWIMPDYNGRYVHVAGGIRRSYEPAGSRAKTAVQVFFFGGSSMFGVFQRDGHTIPSEFARLAQAHGIPVKVWNFAQIAYVNWQEVLQFEELVSSGRLPDLAVFYDGANELVSQFRSGPHTDPSHVQAAQFAKLLPLGGVSQPASVADGESPLSALYHAWGNVSATNWLSRRLRGVPTNSSPTSALVLPPWAGDQNQQAVQAGEDAATLYTRGVDLAQRVAGSYHIGTAFFWQPIFYSKRSIPGELQGPELLGTDPVAWKRAYAVAQSRLKQPVIDIANALNSVATPIMYDFVHTNEAGASVAAQAIYERLAPTLRALARRQRG
jgi:hypothetical protein